MTAETCNDKDKGKSNDKDAAVAEMLFGQRSGFLHCAAHDEAVGCFGRNDGFVASVKITLRSKLRSFAAVENCGELPGLSDGWCVEPVEL
jgi:hypothetical protein